MLLSAVSVFVVAQSSSEIPEGLMNNPVFMWSVFSTHQTSNISVTAINRFVLELQIHCVFSET